MEWFMLQRTIPTKDFIGAIPSGDLKCGIDINDWEINLKRITNNNRCRSRRRMVKVIKRVAFSSLRLLQLISSLLTIFMRSFDNFSLLLTELGPLSCSTLPWFFFYRHTQPLSLSLSPLSYRF
uniref:Uncharacterized protein n=1 Tax=Opuntia streptacantha TaxID=393608 RepID=A0A7C8YHS6_OPUST